MKNGHVAITIIIIFTLIFTINITFAFSNEEQEPMKPKIPVTDIDYDFETTMFTGKNQIISATPLPQNATYDGIYYSSSNPGVATINQMGRIRAISVGTTIITISAGGVTVSQQLTVKSDIIRVEDLDVDTFDRKMTIGDSEILSVAVIPSDATEQKIHYSSSDTAIATVNQVGRIRAINPGTVVITVRCDGITKYIALTVKEEVKITEIDIGEYNKKMKVKERQNLSVTIYPSDAKEQKITYTSSNPDVATVSSMGQIVARSLGKTTITIRAGDTSKKLQITVIQETKKLTVNTNYITMKPGGTKQIKVYAYPKKANQKITFKSLSPSVASVSKSGKIMALKEGYASILVSNGDASQVVSVIVNSSGLAAGGWQITEKQFTQIVENGKKAIHLKSRLLRILSTSFLKVLSDSKKSVTVEDEAYELTIDGKDIKNINNKLDTEIDFLKEKNGLKFIINNGNPLPGLVKIKLNDDNSYEYLYLYNRQKSRYQQLNYNGESEIIIDEGGTYLLTNDKLNKINVNKKILAVSGIVVFVLIIIYVVERRKYWFW